MCVVLHGCHDLVEGVFALKVLKELVGEAGGVIYEGVVGSPVEDFLKRTAERDAVCVLVHAVEQDRTDKNPGGGSGTAALALAMDLGGRRGLVEGFGEPECSLELVLDAL